MSKLSHFNRQGDAYMIDIGAKERSQRIAIAEGEILMSPATLNLILEGKSKKGDVLGVARLAGIMAAKKTSDLIPLCHPLSLSSIEIELDQTTSASGIYCKATVKTTGQTGVEMEALTAVQITLLTVYDMCKAVDREMTINMVRLIEKSGGKSGHWIRD